MIEPSPTPWHLFDDGTQIRAQGPPDAPVIVVADTHFWRDSPPERALADAQRIVDAVNAYEDLSLLAALAWTLTHTESPGIYQRTFDALQTAAEKWRQDAKNATIEPTA